MRRLWVYEATRVLLERATWSSATSARLLNRIGQSAAAAFDDPTWQLGNVEDGSVAGGGPAVEATRELRSSAPPFAALSLSAGRAAIERAVAAHDVRVPPTQALARRLSPPLVR